MRKRIRTLTKINSDVRELNTKQKQALGYMIEAFDGVIKFKCEVD